jgi:hypothetical protein
MKPYTPIFIEYTFHGILMVYYMFNIFMISLCKMCSHEQDKEAGDDPEIEDILKACCS